MLGTFLGKLQHFLGSIVDLVVARGPNPRRARVRRNGPDPFESTVHRKRT